MAAAKQTGKRAMSIESGSRRRPAGRASRLVALLLGAAVLAAGCSGAAAPGGAGATGGPSAAPNPSASSPAGATYEPPYGGGGQAGGGATGGSVQAGGDLCDLLGPGDFGAVGVAGAGAPKENPSGNAAYCIYAGLSAASGGIELDAFVLGSADEASTDFGEVGLYALDPAAVTALGAAKAGYYPDQPGNDPGTTFDELRFLKGRIWFVLSIPSSSQAEDQLLALAKLVLERAAALL